MRIARDDEPLIRHSPVCVTTAELARAARDLGGSLAHHVRGLHSTVETAAQERVTASPDGRVRRETSRRRVDALGFALEGGRPRWAVQGLEDLARACDALGNLPLLRPTQLRQYLEPRPGSGSLPWSPDGSTVHQREEADLVAWIYCDPPCEALREADGWPAAHQRWLAAVQGAADAPVVEVASG